MKLEHIKRPTGLEYIHVTEIPEMLVHFAAHEIHKLIPPEFNDDGVIVNPDTGEEIRVSRAWFLNHIFRDYPAQEAFSDSQRLIQEVANKSMNLDFMPSSPFNYLQNFAPYKGGIGEKSGILLSVFENEASYGSHEDRAMVSGVFWLSDNDEFTGGEFVFNQFNERIEPKKGTGVLFPSLYSHEVFPVYTQPNSFTRYTVTWFGL